MKMKERAKVVKKFLKKKVGTGKCKCCSKFSFTAIFIGDGFLCMKCLSAALNILGLGGSAVHNVESRLRKPKKKVFKNLKVRRPVLSEGELNEMKQGSTVKTSSSSNESKGVRPSLVSTGGTSKNFGWIGDDAMKDMENIRE